MPSRPDPALRLPPDPRQAGRDVIAEGWACPAKPYGLPCGLPKTPERSTCGRPRCRAWEGRQKRKAAAEAEAMPAVVAMRARR